MDLSHSMRGEERELSPNAPLATLSDAAASGVLRQLLRAVRGCRTFSFSFLHYSFHHTRLSRPRGAGAAGRRADGADAGIAGS
eukprot:COSAG03_NODE_875_length_5530_cov_16.331615_3_plen_83_part_00